MRRRNAQRRARVTQALDTLRDRIGLVLGAARHRREAAEADLARLRLERQGVTTGTENALDDPELLERL
ncbi:hypothetical protein, partial [Saccharomonospora iraqiensis]|uniref:hypothetical protein n=1 Tax=Saccharomonospora iraqiensis TaxID=52698 RepID=UPI00054D4EEC